MFPKFQTPKHLKIDLDQVYLLNWKNIFKTHNKKTPKDNITYEWFLTPAISHSLLSQYILERSFPELVFLYFFHIKIFL